MLTIRAGVAKISTWGYVHCLSSSAFRSLDFPFAIDTPQRKHHVAIFNFTLDGDHRTDTSRPVKLTSLDDIVAHEQGLPLNGCRRRRVAIIYRHEFAYQFDFLPG
jgi:hypothetical protein